MLKDDAMAAVGRAQPTASPGALCVVSAFPISSNIEGEGTPPRFIQAFDDGNPSTDLDAGTGLRIGCDACAAACCFKLSASWNWAKDCSSGGVWTRDEAACADSSLVLEAQRAAARLLADAADPADMRLWSDADGLTATLKVELVTSAIT